MTSKRPIARGIADALAGLPLVLSEPLYRHWHLRWGATDSELREPMPGDDAVTTASFSATRAITIDAPPALVWPWIVQMGYRRAGFYTYALLDAVDWSRRVTFMAITVDREATGLSTREELLTTRRSIWVIFSGRSRDEMRHRSSSRRTNNRMQQTVRPVTAVEWQRPR